jgi:predicted DsbA family dithiol-disulfide isomerase
MVGAMSDHTVELHIDPVCPWAWLTSRWLYEAERIRPFTVVTKFFSLAEVNRAEDDKRDTHNAGERALRVLVAARREGGEAAIRALYTEMGEAHHERDEGLGDDSLRAAVTKAGLNPQLVDEALADPSTLTELLGEHGQAIGRGAFGVPSLSVDGSPPYFGPVVDTRITGEDAGRLWDMVAPLLVEPHLFELKRSRTNDPEVGRYAAKRAEVAAAAG